jgi:hypothetical protein
MTNTIKIDIAKLVPYESAGVQTAINRKIAQISAGETIKPPRIVMINDMPMVKDGNNTVLAYKHLGYSYVECQVESLDCSLQQSFIDTLKIRLEKEQVGFNNFLIVQTDEDRLKITTSEHNDYLDNLLFENLEKNLKNSEEI